MVLEDQNVISRVKVGDFGLHIDFFAIVSWKMLVLEIWSVVFCRCLLKTRTRI